MKNKNFSVGDIFILLGEKHEQIVVSFNRTETYPNPSAAYTNKLGKRRILFLDRLSKNEYVKLGADKVFIERLKGNLDKKTRDAVNAKLGAASSGNKYYRSRSLGLSTMLEICSEYGIHPESGSMQFWDLEAKRLNRGIDEEDSGKINIDIAFSRLTDEAEDEFDYMYPINSSYLVFSWYELQNSSYEIIAYLS